MDGAIAALQIAKQHLAKLLFGLSFIPSLGIVSILLRSSYGYGMWRIIFAGMAGCVPAAFLVRGFFRSNRASQRRHEEALFWRELIPCLIIPIVLCFAVDTKPFYIFGRLVQGASLWMYVLCIISQLLIIQTANNCLPDPHCEDLPSKEAQDTIVYEGIAPNAFAAQLKDKTFKDTKRRGKHFWVVLDEGPHPLFHLGMTGKFVVRSPSGEFLKAEMKRAIFEEKAAEIKVTQIEVTKETESNTNNNNNNTNVKKENEGNETKNSESDEKFEMSVDEDFEKPRGDEKKKQKKKEKKNTKASDTNADKEEKDENKKKKKNSKKKNKDESEDQDGFEEREAVIIAETEWPPRWHKLLIEFDDGTKMAFSDPRRLGRIRVRADPATEEPIKSLGYDPILDDIDEETFNTMVLKRKAPIKALLLDQTVFAGVGNWIADEVLYQSSIHPARPSNTLTTTELAQLKTHVKDVIQTAVNVGADWRQFPKTWLFHFRWDKAKKNKKHVDGTGEAIEFVTVGGRTSAVVVSKQIPPADYDPNKKKKGKKRKKSESESVEEESSESSAPPKKKQKKSSAANEKDKKKEKPSKKKKSLGKKKKSKKDLSLSSSSDSDSDFDG